MEFRTSLNAQLGLLQQFRNLLKVEGVCVKALWVRGLNIKSRHSALDSVPLMGLWHLCHCWQQDVEHTHLSCEIE